MNRLQKLILAWLLSSMFVLDGHAQTNQWTWVSGNSVVDLSNKNYGTKGVPAATNYPGSRSGSITFSDDKGNFWLFGGVGYDAAGKVGLLNDLWKFDGTNWTWLSGSTLSYQLGNYGKKGVADSLNIPGARSNGTGYIDNNGNLWLFGGLVLYDRNNLYSIEGNDLWKWDGTNWTYVNGFRTDSISGVVNPYKGYYGTQGVAAASNRPGGRMGSTGWKDKNGNFWLFGGRGYDSCCSTTNRNNDLWKWDGTNWTWIQGSPNAATATIAYGFGQPPSSFNTPGGRYGAKGFTDKSGNLWLFGGSGYTNTFPVVKEGNFNDVWKWDGSSWTFIKGDLSLNSKGVFGTKGNAGTNNMPPGLENWISWTDSLNNFWIYGGDSATLSYTGRYDINYYGFSTNYYNSLWKWDGSNWTWVNGKDSITRNDPGNYGSIGITDPNNMPSSRSQALGWRDAKNKLWLYGGFGAETNIKNYPVYRNDLWTWDGNNWNWMNGIDSFGLDVFGNYGSKGIPSSVNKPDARSNSVTWTDSNGNLWMFGGESHVAPYDFYNDTWKWDGNNWTWVNGSNTRNQFGVYGTKGVSAATNYPGARSASAGWTDNLGNQWIFGGKVVSGVSSTQNNFVFSNDLWKYDGTNWTWMNGNSANNKYGTRGVADTSNIPERRSNAVTWTDRSGNLWMFGGWDNIITNRIGPYTIGTLNDVWKWDGTAWTWMKGSNTYNQNGIYGTLGIADTANTPGSRHSSVSWKDKNDNVWVFGGKSQAGLYNELWKWDGTGWTWMNGSNIPDPRTANYGTKGIASKTNLPGERWGATGWVDDLGNFWLFGGIGKDAYQNEYYLNDLWVWNGGTWIWMDGSNQVLQNGVYGQKGIPSSKNIPGARMHSNGWKDKLGNFWLFGGSGFTNIYIAEPEVFSASSFNDLWKLNVGVVTAINNTSAVPTPTTILLLNNPSTLNQFSFVADQNYRKLHWQIEDINGRTLQEGNLNTILKSSVQTVPIQQITNGIYFIRFIGDDKKIQTLKWIKL